MILTILLALIVIVIWLLMVPVSIVVNTQSDDYRIEQRGTFRFRVLFDPVIKGELAIVGIHIPMAKRDKNTRKKTENGSRKKRHQRSPGEWVKLVKSMLRAFRVNRLNLDIDTGDVVANAQLVPVFLLVSRPPLHAVTNFEGKVLLDIDISFHIYKAVLAFLRFKLKI